MVLVSRICNAGYVIYCTLAYNLLHMVFAVRVLVRFSAAATDVRVRRCTLRGLGADISRTGCVISLQPYPQFTLLRVCSAALRFGSALRLLIYVNWAIHADLRFRRSGASPPLAPRRLTCGIDSAG